MLAGFDRRSPISIDQDGRQFAQPLGRDFKGVRVAMFKDLGLPWEPEVAETIKAQQQVFASLGCSVEEAEPDFRNASECFLTWRHWSLELAFGDILEANGEQLNQYVHWHVEQGRRLAGPQLVLPVNQVLPFDVHTHYPGEIAGVKMENYLAWMKSAYYLSTVGNPAISVPCGFSKNGLPIGIQIVGRHHDDWGLLQMGYAFEQATNVGSRRPPIV